MPSVVETIYRFKHDRNTINAVLRDQGRVTDAVQDTDRASERLADAYSDTERAAKRTAAAQRDAAEASIRAAREQGELYGDTASRLSSLSGLSSGLGGAALSGRIMLAADVLDAVEAMRLMSAEVPALVGQLSTGTLALGAVGLAVAGLAGGLYLLGKSAEESRQAVLRSIEFERRRSELGIRDLTTQQIQEEIESRRDLVAQYDEDIERQRALREQLFESYSAWEQLTEALGVQNQGLDDYDDRIQELQDEREIEMALILELRDALGLAAVAANDAIDAEKQLADERAGASARAFSGMLEAFQAADSLTTDQLNDRIEALDRERTALEVSGYILTDAGQARADEIESIKMWLNNARDAIAMREAEEALLKQQEEAAKRAEAAALAAYQQAEQILRVYDEFTPEQLDQAIGDIEREQEAITATAYGMTEAGQTRYAELEAMKKWLEEARPTIQARADEAQALADQEALLKKTTDAIKQHADQLADINKARNEVKQAYEDIQQAHRDYATETVEVEADRQREALEDQADFARERVRDLADHYADMADIDAKYYRDRDKVIADMGEALGEIGEKRVDEARDLNEDLEDLAKEHGKRVLDIQQRADDTIHSAALRRDAIAIYEAQKQAQRDLEAERDQYQEEQDEREQAYREAMRLLFREQAERLKAGQEALRTLELQHRREQQEREQAFRLRLQRDDEDRRIRLQRQQEGYAREDAERHAAFISQLQGLQTHHFNVANELRRHYDEMYAIHRGGLSRIEAAPASVGGGLAGLGGLPSYDGGGYTPSGAIQTRRGEYVLDPTTTRLAERGVGQRLSQGGLRQMISQVTYGGNPLTVNAPAPIDTGAFKQILDRWWEGKMRAAGATR